MKKKFKKIACKTFSEFVFSELQKIQILSLKNIALIEKNSKLYFKEEVVNHLPDNICMNSKVTIQNDLKQFYHLNYSVSKIYASIKDYNFSINRKIK